MPRPDLPAIKDRTSDPRPPHRLQLWEIDLLRRDLDALLTYVDEQDRELAEMKEQIVKMTACLHGKLD